MLSHRLPQAPHEDGSNRWNHGRHDLPGADRNKGARGVPDRDAVRSARRRGRSIARRPPALPSRRWFLPAHTCGERITTAVTEQQDGSNRRSGIRPGPDVGGGERRRRGSPRQRQPPICRTLTPERMPGGRPAPGGPERPVRASSSTSLAVRGELPARGATPPVGRNIPDGAPPRVSEWAVANYLRSADILPRAA